MPWIPFPPACAGDPETPTVVAGVSTTATETSLTITFARTDVDSAKVTRGWSLA